MSSTTRNHTNMEGRYWWHVVLPNNVGIYVTERIKPQDCVVRMNMIYPTAGEIYYLRLLFLHIPTRSYEELKSTTNFAYYPTSHPNVNDDFTKTFQESCEMNLLLEDENEAIQCFQEAMVFCTPQELRNLFIIQTLQGFSTYNIFNNTDKRKAMSLDYIQRHQQGDTSELAFNDLLIDLASRLQSDGGRYITKLNIT